MKKAVKWTLSTSIDQVENGSGQCRPVRKKQDGRRRPRKQQWSTSASFFMTYCKIKNVKNKSKNNSFFIFPNFDSLRYFCHKNHIQQVMPKVQQKVKILKISLYPILGHKKCRFDHEKCCRRQP